MRLDYWKTAPEAVKALGTASAYLDHCSIEPKLRHLIDLRVSQINGCAFCVDMHTQQLRQAGESQQRLDCLVVWHETTFFSDRERAALEWAESITRVESTHIPDEAYARVREQFNDRELVDLTTIASVMNAWNRMAISFRRGPVEREHSTG